MSAEGLRQYRLSLAQAAHRLREYPNAARSRQQEGSTEIQVTLGLGAPLITIARSSGWELLDEAALRMIQAAVRQTPLPNSLRGKSAQISVPIEFWLKDG